MLTAPRVAGEELDAFVKRVLPDADQERDAAAARGTAIHNALSDMVQGKKPDMTGIEAEVMAAWKVLEGYRAEYPEVACAEKPIVGQGYAGTPDLILSRPGGYFIFDYKSCKSEPGKKITGWPEHGLQLGALCMAWRKHMGHGTIPIRVANMYISTTEPGRVEVVERTETTGECYEAFMHLLEVFKWQKGLK